MKLRLNRNRPFAELFGAELEFPGAKYQQDGHFFRLDGSLLGEPIEVEADVVTSSKPLKGSQEELHWIKQQLAIYNEPYKTLPAARRFLDGKE